MSLNNIYKNSFYSEPIPLWAFTVDFEIKTPNLDESELLTLSKSITNCPLAERSIQTTDIFFNGFKRSVPTQATTDGIISLTFSENTNLDVTRIISKMYKYSYNDLATSQDFFKEVDATTNLTKWVGDTTLDTYDYKKTNFEPFKVNLKIFDADKCALNTDFTDNDDYLVKISYYNCVITKIGSVDFKYDSEDIMEIQVDIHYDYMRELNV